MTLALTFFEWLRYSQQISENFQKCDYKISSLNGLSCREKLKRKNILDATSSWYFHRGI